MTGISTPGGEGSSKKKRGSKPKNKSKGLAPPPLKIVAPVPAAAAAPKVRVSVRCDARSLERRGASPFQSGPSLINRRILTSRSSCRPARASRSRSPRGILGGGMATLPWPRQGGRASPRS